MTKKKKEEKTDANHDDFENFEININKFGEIDSSINKDEINKFLNKFHQDKKIQDSHKSEEE